MANSAAGPCGRCSVKPGRQRGLQAPGARDTGESLSDSGLSPSSEQTAYILAESFHRFETRSDYWVCGPSSGLASSLLCEPGKAPIPLRDSVSGEHSQTMCQICTPTPILIDGEGPGGDGANGGGASWVMGARAEAERRGGHLGLSGRCPLASGLCL